jgi:hypothetical protein
VTLTVQVAPREVTAAMVAPAPCRTFAGRLVMRTESAGRGGAVGAGVGAEVGAAVGGRVAVGVGVGPAVGVEEASGNP